MTMMTMTISAAVVVEDMGDRPGSLLGWMTMMKISCFNGFFFF
jgi:hypothetical protein